MKIAALSDMHGNDAALDAVLADIDKQGADHILILGDMIADFPHTVKTILQTVRGLPAHVIRGNREGYLIKNAAGEYGDDWEKYDQFETSRQIYRQLDPNDLAYLRALPVQMAFEFDGLSIRMVHGSPFSERDEIREGADDLIARSLAAIPEKILLCGHAHQPMIKRIGEKTAVNVGSAGGNFDGDSHAQYTIIESDGGNIRIGMRKTPYDFAAFKATYDMESIWERLCIKGIEDGVNCVVMFFEEAQKRCDDWPIPNEIWNGLAAEWAAKGKL